ncbi:MAG TPA: alpha/beta hydrolase-fold protein [Streptosporangiaceae bacterium]|nr:alpha/beta hydrolase-fold protein [Streptosporangiaceae bacterium]
MPQPQSTAFFLLLLVMFAGLVCWLVLTRHVVLRVLAACLAFIPAVLFGVAAVNKYYDYYQSWNSAIADLTSEGVPGTISPPATAPTAPRAGSQASGSGTTSLLGNQVITKLAQANGYTLTLTVHGRLSGLTRTVYVYLPPQYFRPAYAHYKFPVIELIHGYPGAPQDWITVLDITSTLSSLVEQHLAKPAVLVMPDANGARGISLQCLNSLGGPQDATFMARDVPDYISDVLRVWLPGRTWGIAGYSEGGFCAANLGLQYGKYFGVAGVLSGYFSPDDNQEGTPPRPVNPFGADKQLRRANTPTLELLKMPAGAVIPQFWIGSGTDKPDVKAAEAFKQLLQLRQPSVQLQLVPGGGHSMSTWRVLVPPMLEWMTQKLAINVKEAQARARRLSHHRAAPTPRSTHFRSASNHP